MGNINVFRDWGHAKDYVRMKWKMLQQDTPEDFVIATGLQHSVRDFIKWSALELGLELKFSGNGVEEVGTVIDIVGDLAPAVKKGDKIVCIDPRYFRPVEVESLLGNPSKAKEKLDWSPNITAKELCAEMVLEDYKTAKRTKLLMEYGLDLPLSIEK
jgi:GDPmannose 4,6-dehydratase